MERGESEEDEDETGRGSVIDDVEAERGDEEGKGEMERGESEEDEDEEVKEAILFKEKEGNINSF